MAQHGGERGSWGVIGRREATPQHWLGAEKRQGTFGDLEDRNDFRLRQTCDRHRGGSPEPYIFEDALLVPKREVRGARLAHLTQPDTG